MTSRQSLNNPPIWILLLLFISNIALAIDKELPSFVELPPPIQYFTTGEISIELKCTVWPSTAKVQFMVSSKKMWSNNLNPSQNTVELNQLDRNIGELLSPGRLKISNQINFNNIQDQNIHCLTATDFATVLSRPFRVTRAGMSDFGGDTKGKSKTVKKSFLSGNVGLIDCYPPESHPRSDVKFDLNGAEIKEGGKYRIVNWPDGKRISLLIHPVEESDRGQYRCIATNPITRQTKVSLEIINLTVEVPKITIPPSITMPISGRLGGAQQIIARKGTNITLFCVMQGAPPPRVQIYNNDATSNSRYRMDPDFGMLHITDIRESDAGSYMCTDKIMTTSAVLKVIEPLNITTRPVNVVLDNLSSSAKFDCVASKPSIVVQWFFNGRPLAATSNGSLHIQAVTATDLGIYQCVAQDHDEWVSAAATLSINSYNLISQPLQITEDLIQAPINQNIDKQEQIISIPIGERIVDNMAAYVHWKLINDKLGEVSYFVLQYIYKTRTDSLWSIPATVQEKINVSHYYLTSRYVQPQNSYRFRVHSFYNNGHTVTSNWSKETNFFNVGNTAPVIEESSVKSPGMITMRWSYQSVDVWPVDTFRILYRRALDNSTTKFEKYFKKDVSFPTMNVTIDNLEPASSYQLIVYGINDMAGSSRTITKFSQSHTVSLPLFTKTTPSTTSSSTSRFFSGLVESWKSNKLLYGSLFALTGFLIVVMFLLLLLCLCRQRRFRNNKDSSSSHTFPYAYKEVCKTSTVANNNNSSTLQIPGRMPQYSSQMALQQFQSNNGSIDRRKTENGSQMHRAGSSQAMETASMVTDLYSPNYMHGMPMSHMQHHPYQGFSTLPQGYPNSHHNNSRNNPQYQHFLQQQPHHQAHMGSIRRENPTGESNRDSLIDQSMEMPSRAMSASQQQLMMMQQSQEHQRANLGYYNARAGAMSPQMMMMMGSQQSLYGPYRRSNSQNYQGHMETPIAISATGHPVYQMDQMMVDSSGRPLSPQYQYMQQQQHQQQAAQLGAMHPSMMEMYNQSQGYIRPGPVDYAQQSLYRQQYRRSDSDCGEPGYSYLPTNLGPEMMAASRQHTLNSLPEQPGIDIGNRSQQHPHQQQHDSPGNTASNNSNNNSSGRHHHRRKTRNRQQNVQDNPSLERVQGNHGDMPPMLAPRSKMPYPDNASMQRLSGHDMNTADCQDLSIHDCNSESNNTGDNFDPPLQYSAHYDPHDPNDNETTPNNSMLIENLPRIRDVSEYGIPINNNNHNQRPLKPKQPQQPLQSLQQHQAPVPPLKTNSRHNPQSNNGYNMECNPDYYSSATSSDRSGPSPPPKYAPGNVPLTRPEDVYIKNLYYHGDTHC